LLAIVQLLEFCRSGAAGPFQPPRVRSAIEKAEISPRSMPATQQEACQSAENRL